MSARQYAKRRGGFAIIPWRRASWMICYRSRRGDVRTMRCGGRAGWSTRRERDLNG